MRLTGRAETKVGDSDPVSEQFYIAHTTWVGHRSTDKSYSRDNRLIAPKRPQRRSGLAPQSGCCRSNSVPKIRLITVKP